MTDKELNDYKAEVEKNFGPCAVLTSESYGTMTNADKTGDRDAYKGIDWIDYWRAMTDKHSDTLYCGSCGKEITNNPSMAQYVRFSQGDS